jgi:CheY-like chemotaxis protein
MIKKIITEAKIECDFIEFDTADKANLYLETAGNIDFATIDQNMPGVLSGLDLAETILNKLPKTKIALVTANVQDTIRERAANLGIDFIDKPISPEKLLPLFGRI